MRSVAEAVGVQGPSLYKRVPDRAALFEPSPRASWPTCRDACPARPRPATRAPTCAPPPSPIATFVPRNPNGYRLLFADLPAGASPDPAALAALGEPIVKAMAGLVGPTDALEAARTFVAWAHGFVSMELAGAFRLGGDLDAAYAFGIESILAGVSAPATPASR